MSDEISVDALRDLILRQQLRIDGLEKRMHLAEKQVEAAEQYTRQDCLILRGKLDVRPNYPIRDEVMRIIYHQTGVQFPPWCLNTCHWLGTGDSLIVRFNNKGVREAIYRNRIPKDKNKRGLFIHESLTSTKVQTISKCAKLRREEKISTYYTQSGNVFIKRAKETPPILVPDNLTEHQICEMLERQPTSYREATLATSTQRSQGQGTHGTQAPSTDESAPGDPQKTQRQHDTREGISENQSSTGVPGTSQASESTLTHETAEEPEVSHAHDPAQTSVSTPKPKPGGTTAQIKQKGKTPAAGSQRGTTKPTSVSGSTPQTSTTEAPDQDTGKGGEKESLASDSEADQDVSKPCQEGDTTSEASSPPQTKKKQGKPKKKKHKK